MVSDEKIAVFLKLQQVVLDIDKSSNLLNKFLPVVLENLAVANYPYIFLYAIFTDPAGKVKQSYFIDRNNTNLGQIAQPANPGGNVLRTGNEWEMKVLYGEAAVVQDIGYFINPSYPEFSKIHSLLILPILRIREFQGVLILASPQGPDKIDSEEIEFGEMIARLVDLAFRLQDTEESLTKITQQVYAMNAKLHQLDKLKDDFVSIASHELRTPMTAIRSYAWMALHRSDVPLSKTLEKYIVRVLLSTERLINLVNDMLNVSRIESGRIEIEPEPVDLHSLVKDIIDELYFSKSEEKKIHFVILESQVPKVLADPEKLRQVFLNLVGNSLKFTPDGGKITFSFFSDGKTVETAVSDTGVGISREDLSKLFNKFGRLDNSYTAAATSGGTGLGLYISKSLVNLMHGYIKVYSEGLNKGSTFTVSLPVASPEVLKEIDRFRVTPQGEAKPLEPVAI